MLTLLILLLNLFKIPSNVLGFQIMRSRNGYKSVQHESRSEGNEKKSIAIVGSGAVGCYYGARLFESNLYNVIFYMRGDHFRVSKECGLNLTSIDSDVFIPPGQLQAYDKIEDIGKVDWVILALKSTSIEAIPELLLPLLQEKRTRVICTMNGFVDEDIVRLLEGGKNKDIEPKLTKCAAVYAGMAFLCSNRIAPGKVDHSYFGKLCSSLVASSSDNQDDLKLHETEIVNLWEPTKVDFEYEPIYTKARWSKNVWNLPFNGISVAMNGITIDQIVNDPGLRTLANTIMDETIAIANKDLASRGYSREHFLGEAEVRNYCICVSLFCWLYLQL